MAARKQNERREKFAQLVAEGKSLSDAYRGAGFISTNPSTVNSTASRLYHSEDIQQRIAEIRAELYPARIMTAKEIQQKLTEFATRTEQPDGVIPSIAEATRAAEILCRISGLFLDRKEVNVSGSLPVVISDDVKE